MNYFGGGGGELFQIFSWLRLPLITFLYSCGCWINNIRSKCQFKVHNQAYIWYSFQKYKFFKRRDLYLGLSLDANLSGVRVSYYSSIIYYIQWLGDFIGIVLRIFQNSKILTMKGRVPTPPPQLRTGSGLNICNLFQFRMIKYSKSRWFLL